MITEEILIESIRELKLKIEMQENSLKWARERNASVVVKLTVETIDNLKKSLGRKEKLLRDLKENKFAGLGQNEEQVARKSIFVNHWQLMEVEDRSGSRNLFSCFTKSAITCNSELADGMTVQTIERILSEGGADGNGGPTAPESEHGIAAIRIALTHGNSSRERLLAGQCGGRLDFHLTADKQETDRVVSALNLDGNRIDRRELFQPARVEAAEVALSQLRLGVPVQDIIVPVIIGTSSSRGCGDLVQFGAVILLLPACPMYTAITPVLDLRNAGDLKEAAVKLACIRLMLNANLVPAAAAPAAAASCPSAQPSQGKSLAYRLLRAPYHIKRIEDFYCSTGELSTSLDQHFRVMAELQRSPSCRPLVVFPVCVAQYEDNKHIWGLVYPRLGLGYIIGLPCSPTWRRSYLAELWRAVHAFHAAGVVHLDLYPSNIMWRLLEEGPAKVEIKIVDWDAAHFTREQLSRRSYERSRKYYRPSVVKMALKVAPDKMLAQPNEGSSTKMKEKKSFFDDFEEGVSKGVEPWLRRLDLALLVVLETFIDDESLQSHRKEELDEAFVECQRRFVDEEW